MKKALNIYGDRMIDTSGSHGSDISSQRIDDLDRAAIEFVLNGLPGDGAICDIGCGAGVQGMRFAMLGAQVEFYDLVDISARIEAFGALFPTCRARFFAGDIRQTFRRAGAEPLGAAYSQRTIHYLPYREAEALFARVAGALSPGGRFFVSASGLNSELGIDYPGRAFDPNGRFHALSPEMAEKHQIKTPVCLYSEEDIARLALDTGFDVVKIWSSDFGNIKAILGRT